MHKIYGIHAVSAALQLRSKNVAKVLLQQGRDDERLQQLRHQAEAAGIDIRQLPRAELDQMVDGRHQGAVAYIKQQQAWSEKDLPDILQGCGNDALVLVLDGVTDPHNLGACLRSADAAGAHAVIAPKDKSASLNATARKVACGAAEHIPFISVTNLARSLKLLQDYGLWLVGTAGEAEQSLYDMDLTGPTAIVMGAEGPGLRRLTRQHCDHLAKLPMSGSVSSLNVSVATGVCLFEARRQRLSKV